MPKKRIAITCGDPSGLGPELIERCLVENAYPEAEFTIFGPSDWADKLAANSKSAARAISVSDRRFVYGTPEAEGARAAIVAMEGAAEACLAGDCDAVVTGPIAKSLCAAVGYAFPGQTEFFAARWGGEPTMAFVGDHLKLCLATWHVPLLEVGRHLTEAALRRAVMAAEILARRLGAPLPRVMVCGLNPHAGEAGLLGREELDALDPWLAKLRDETDATLIGCVPGDTAFARAMKGECDVVVALYHDQGLAPFKAVDFDSGVNVTLGLTRLRVSPDHGTGFDIAGRGIASAGSMQKAIELAIRLS